LNSGEGTWNFSWFSCKQGKSEWCLCFIFLFRWFFGLIRPRFCYVTFLKIPLLIEEISCILWFFWESFYRKDPSNGFLMERSIFIFVSFSNFGQLVVFSFLQIFLTCFLAFRSPQNFCRGFDLFGFIFRFSFSIQKQKLFFISMACFSSFFWLQASLTIFLFLLKIIPKKCYMYAGTHFKKVFHIRQ